MRRVSVLLMKGLVLCIGMVLLGCSGGSKPSVIVPPTVKDLVYAANAAGTPATVSAFIADRTSGSLTAVSGSPFGTGSGSYALAADPAGKFLYVANYFSGDISAFALDPTTGALTAVSGSPFTAELGVDSLAIDPAGKFLYAVTGRSENLWAYSIGSTGVLVPVSGFPTAIAPSGTVSNSVIMDPAGKYLYVANGDSLSANIYGFSRDATSGTLTALTGFPVSLDGWGNKAAFDPTGKFLLITGTGVFGMAGGVTVFSLDSSSGVLTEVTSAIQVGTDPSGVTVDASGKFVYIPNTADATVSSFTLDASGGLTAIGAPIPSGGKGTINGPMGIAADVAGHFVYICNASNDISVFSINSTSGALTSVTGSPFPVGGNGPSAIIFVKNRNAASK